LFFQRFKDHLFSFSISFSKYILQKPKNPKYAKKKKTPKIRKSKPKK